MGSRESKMLITLGIILYIALFYKFNITVAIPEIKEVKAEIKTETLKLDELKEDYKNIDIFKQQLSFVNIYNDRASEYIPNRMNVTNTTEYIERITKLFPEEILNIKIGSPEKKENYISHGINFETTLDLNSLQDLIGVIENSTTKAKLVEFQISDDKDNVDIEEDSQNKRYFAKLDVEIYSLDIEDGKERIFGDRFAGEFEVQYDIKKENNPNLEGNISNGILDVRIRLQSFLTGGDNVTVFGRDSGSKFFTYKSVQRSRFNINIDDEKYTVTSVLSDGTQRNFTDTTPNRSLNLHMNADFANISENKNLGGDIYITNNSKQNLRIIFNDSTGSLNLFDRDGNKIRWNSSSEKAFIF